MKRMISLFAALVLALCLAVSAAATGSVTYDGAADKFVFAPGTAQSPTSLFEDFQLMMPGDERTERLELRNARGSGVRARVYVRALGAQEGTDEFLSRFTLTVRQADDSVLFDAPANETAQLGDWVCLGTIAPGGKIALDATLAMDIAADNAWQHQTGYFDWQFKVEELPIEKTPGTGDSSHAALWVALTLGGVLAVVGVKRPKPSARRNEE